MSTACKLQVGGSQPPGDCHGCFKKGRSWERCRISSLCCLGNAAQRKLRGNQEEQRVHGSSNIFSHPIQHFKAMQPCHLLKKPLILKVKNNQTKDVKTGQQAKFSGTSTAETGINQEIIWVETEGSPLRDL